MKTIPGIAEIMSLGFLFSIGLVFSVVMCLQVIHGTDVSPIATGFVTTILGYVINSLGVKRGVDSTNDTVAKTAIAQYPLTQQQKSDALSEPNLPE